MTPEQINRLLKSTLLATRSELRRSENLKKLYRFGDQVLPGLLTGVVESGSERLVSDLEAGKTAPLREVTRVVYARLLPKLKPDYPLTQLSVDLFFLAVLTPTVVRELLIEALSETNAQRLERYLYSEASGLQSLLIRFVDFQKYLAQLRTFLLDHPEEAEDRILVLLDDLEVRERLAERLYSHDWDNLPLETQTAIGQFLDRCLMDTLMDHGPVLTGMLTALSPDISRMMTRFLVENDWLGWAATQYVDTPEQPLARWLHQILPGDVLETLLDTAEHRERNYLLWRWLAPVLAGLAGILLGLWIGLSV